VDRPRTDRALVVVPAWNESEVLPQVLAELRRHVPDLDVLVVDDGSSDGTADIVRADGPLRPPAAGRRMSGVRRPRHWAARRHGAGEAPSPPRG